MLAGKTYLLEDMVGDLGIHGREWVIQEVDVTVSIDSASQ